MNDVYFGFKVGIGFAISTLALAAIMAAVKSASASPWTATGPMTSGMGQK